MLLPFIRFFLFLEFFSLLFFCLCEFKSKAKSFLAFFHKIWAPPRWTSKVMYPKYLHWLLYNLAFTILTWKIYVIVFFDTVAAHLRATITFFKLPYYINSYTRLILVFIVLGIDNFVEFINFRITLEKKMRYRNIRHNIIISRHLSLSSQSTYKIFFLTFPAYF